MENKINNNEESEKERKKSDDKKIEDIAKITISKEADDKVMELLKRISNGFEGGRINRQGLISWIVMRFCNECDDNMIENIREDHYDEFLLLEAILKKGKIEGKLPPDFQNLLKQQLGISSIAKTKSNKALTKRYINGVMDESKLEVK